MDYILTKGRPEDYEDIIDFANYVFGEDFPSLLPKLYKNHRECVEHHHLIKESDRIKAMVGSFPLGLIVGDNCLKIRGIGTVSVHRYSRGSGYMKLLMDNAIREMEEEGCDFAVLGGQRQRYEYWGFTPCGVSINLNFNSSNLKHAHVDMKDNYNFVKCDGSISEDLAKALKLYNSQIAHGIREKDNFIDIASSWENNVIFIYNNNEFAGYICASKNNENINEILLVNPDEIDRVLVSYMKYYNLKNTSVRLYMHMSKEFIALSKFCENYSINSANNIYIINYKNVIKAFMDLKNSLSQLCEGTLVINIEKKGKYKIQVKDGVITVEETDMDYDISLSHLEATSLLFSHGTFIKSTYKGTSPLVKAWFPLPIFYPRPDSV